LIYRPAEKDYRAAIGSRARWRNFNDFGLNMEYISGTGRHRPAQLSSGPDNAASEWRTTLNIETHRDRGGVPTARRQAIEERAYRGLLVRVKGLRIELNRERLRRPCRTKRLNSAAQFHHRTAYQWSAVFRKLATANGL